MKVIAGIGTIKSGGANPKHSITGVTPALEVTGQVEVTFSLDISYEEFLHLTRARLLGQGIQVAIGIIQAEMDLGDITEEEVSDAAEFAQWFERLWKADPDEKSDDTDGE